MKSQPKYRILLVAFLILGMVLSLGLAQLYTGIIAPCFAPKSSLDQMYQQAIEDAMVAKESEVYAGLTSIMENNSNLIWQGTQGNESVLVVTWTKYANLSSE